MSTIHPTAVVSAEAEIGPDVVIGAHSVIEGPVRLAAGVKIIAQAHITGHTEIEQECVIHPFAVVGGVPQDRAYTGERSFCRVGPRAIIREGVTIHRGASPESATTVGADCMLMAYSHVGHDCRLGDHVTLTNGVVLAGHVHVGDGCMFGGQAGIHQSVRIGEYAMVGGQGRISQDVAPFTVVTERNECNGLNRIGLRRNGFSRAEIDELNLLYHEFFRGSKPPRRAAESYSGPIETDAGKRLLEFLLTDSKRGIAHGRRKTGGR